MSVSPFNPSRFVKANTCLPCCSACPPADKMLIPPLTEHTGTWFANLAAAMAAFADLKQTSGCIGYQSQVSPSIALFNANAVPFNLSGQGDTDTSSVPKMWGSLNFVSGSVMSCAYDIFNGGGSPITTAITVKLYDKTGTLIETHTTTGNAGNVHLSGTFTFAAVGYTGRYIVYAEIVGPAGGIQPPGSFTFTSDRTTTTNTIVALYDTGALVPSCLSCA